MKNNEIEIIFSKFRNRGTRRSGNVIVIENQEVNYSDELSRYPNIDSLTIKNNSLNKIPKEVEKLTRLTILDLRENKLKKLPDFLGRLTELEYLILDNNEISELPDAMKDLSNLGRLYLANNRIKSIRAIKSVLLIPGLRVLDLRGNSGLDKLATLYSGKLDLDNLRKIIQK
jgi:Leucine-rich repeat (LRR) protein